MTERDGRLGPVVIHVTPQQHASGELTVEAAIDRAKATGGIVQLAPGHYDVRRTVLTDHLVTGAYHKEPR